MSEMEGRESEDCVHDKVMTESHAGNIYPPEGLKCWIAVDGGICRCVEIVKKFQVIDVEICCSRAAAID